MNRSSRRFVTQAANIRLDRLVADYIGCGRRHSARLIKNRLVLVNGRAAKASDNPRAGDEIEIEGFETVASPFAPSDSTAPIVIFETQDLLILNKQTGWHTHSGLGVQSVADYLATHRGEEQRLVGDRPEEAGIAHRLDRDTSGVVIAAKNRECFTALRAEFSAHKVEKTYLALVTGSMRTNLSIDTELARRGDHVVAATSRDRPLEAYTRVSVLEHGPDWSLVEAASSTGAPHQIRAHLSLCGHPLIGDTTYAGPRSPAIGRAEEVEEVGQAGQSDGRGGHLLHALRVRVNLAAQSTSDNSGPIIDISVDPALHFLLALAALRRDTY